MSRSIFSSAPLGALLLLVAPTLACTTGTVAVGGEACANDFQCAPGVCVDGRCTAAPEEDAGVEPGCEDPDRDGYGPGCSLGPDCDQGDPNQGNREICDGLDNDCDGEADNGVLNACGNCDPGCGAQTSFGGEGPGFDLEDEEQPNDGVGLDGDGAIVLDSERVNTQYIWIANTGEGSVSKVDTETYEEMGRYVTGPDGSGNDPSRTSVNALGDVYVGNRRGGTVSRISALGERCADQNGDGMVTTSSGASTLAWGQDDCVLWNTRLNDGLLRAVAAQDVIGPDGELQQYVWVGGYRTQTAWKLDGVTGEVLVEVRAPVTPYGFALDAAGNLWMASLGSQLGRIDTNNCTSAACTMDTTNMGGTTYGITVDFNQRVWTGGDVIRRYDPADGSVSSVGAGYGFCNGVAADAAGNVFGGCDAHSYVVRIDADNPANSVQIDIPNSSPRGVAVDAARKIWGINRTQGTASVIVPGAALADNTVNAVAANGFAAPYTYSDMTGLQARLAANPRGWWRTTIEGCPEGGSNDVAMWGELDYETEVPTGTSVSFRVQVAETREALGSGEWVTIANVPGDLPPVDVGAALAAAGVPVDMQGRWMLLEVLLQSERTSRDMVITPRVLSLSVNAQCEELVQ